MRIREEQIPRVRSSRRVPVKVTAALASLAVIVAGGAISASAATAAELPETFLGTSSTWKYSDNNTDPAAGNADRLVWTLPGYNDTAWKSGAGAFGAKGGSATPNLGANFPVTTVLNQYIDPTAATKVDVPTFHFRSDFSVTADQLADISGLRGSVTYDDAVQVFVNGTKVAGFVDERVEAVPDAQKNLTYAGTSGGDPASSTFTIPAEVLTAGENTIAIALYQDRATSSDAYLDLKSLTPVTDTPGATVLSDIVLGVGTNESQRNLAWYSSTDTAQVAQLALASSVVNGVFPESATTFAGTGSITTSGEFNRFATFTGLTENASYVYRVGSAGNWSANQTFTTQDFDGDFDFLFFGDPQIGSSGNVANDGAGWADTLDVATKTYPDAELLFSAGDQVEHANNEDQYTAFLQSDKLREIPLVVTNGNHDVGSKAYEQHFNTPNLDKTAGAGSATSSGGDYWFIHKDVLFMNINSNSRDAASHIAWMTKVVEEQGDKAKWSILAFHHSIYSPAIHATDTDIIERRANLPTAISELGIDVVLQGHDHAYARSFLIENGEKADINEVAGAKSVTAGPGGVLYVTANSASGSKYYNLQNKDFWWLSVQNQERVRNYSAIEVTDNTINIKTLRSQANGTELPVNSVVDEVTLNKAPATGTEQLQVVVPEAAPGEFVWSIDGTNGLVDLGTAVDSGDHYAASGAINPIRVTDTRTSGPTWSVSAQVGDFTGSNKSFSGRYLGWTPAVVEAGGDAVAGAKVTSGFTSGGVGLSAASTLGSAAAGHARGSALLGADLDLKIPVDATDGTYQATLTLTALS